MTTTVSSLFRGIVSAFKEKHVRGLLAITSTAVALATFFFAWVENWSYVDALYFSVMTIATVGYGDLAPSTTLGKLGAVGYVLVALGLFVAAVSAIADAIIRQRARDSDDEGRL
jgi:voltage-gated potassium channel